MMTETVFRVRSWHPANTVPSKKKKKVPAHSLADVTLYTADASPSKATELRESGRAGGLGAARQSQSSK